MGDEPIQAQGGFMPPVKHERTYHPQERILLLPLSVFHPIPLSLFLSFYHYLFPEFHILLDVDVLPGLKAGASTPPDGSAVAPQGPPPFLPALKDGVSRRISMIPAV